MLNKRTVIGVFILLALIGGTLWYLHVQRTRPFRDLPRAQVIRPANPPKQETEKGFSYLWRDIDVDLPPEDAPRPFKHLGFKELLRATRTQFTGEEALQLHYEVFFRMSKEQREDLRRSREEARRARDKAKRIEEYLRLYPPSETD